MQPRHLIRVVINEHIAPDQIASMRSTLMASGNVAADADGRTFSVEMYREGKREHLIETLKGWERWGYASWEQVSAIDSQQAAALRDIAREFATLFANGDYGGALARCQSSRLSEPEIGKAIRNYGRTLTPPPANAYTVLDAVAIAGAEPPAWSVRVPLWTVEEGQSDLTVELTISIGPTGLSVALDDLRVL